MSFRMSEADLRKVLSRPGYKEVENGIAPNLRSNERSPVIAHKETANKGATSHSGKSSAIRWQVDLLPTLQKQVFAEIADLEPSEGMRMRMEICRDALFLPIVPMGYIRQRGNDAYLLRKPEASLSKSQIKYVRTMRRYMGYRDELRKLWGASGLMIPEAGMQLTFFRPMYKSWSDDRRREHWGMPSRRKPDTDNLVKGFIDALVEEDEHIWHLGEPAKYWGDAGWIEVRVGPSPALPAMPLPGWLGRT